MLQLPPDSHWATRSHMAALAKLIPPPEVLPALAAGAAGAGAGRAWVPLATTWATGSRVTVEPVCDSLSTCPSTTTCWTVMVRSPATPLVTTFFWSV